jgi:hypothetical protein
MNALLQRVQRAAVGQPLDRRDLGAVLHDRQGQTGEDACSVHQHGAGTALSVVAPFFRSRQIEVLAQGVEQARPGGDVELSRRPVELEHDAGFHTTLLLAAQAARRTTRSPFFNFL